MEIACLDLEGVLVPEIWINFAERTGIGCRSDIARNNCLLFLELVREHSRFALGVTDTRTPLAFGKELKVMHGGLAGLQRLVHPQGVMGTIASIHNLVRDAQQRFASLEALPYQEIVRHVASFRPRRRSTERGR